jgi:predicted nucleotidyltransferase
VSPLPAARLYNASMTTPPPLLDQRVDALLAAGRRIFLDSPANLRAAILYGSSLGQSFRPDSDIDVAILDASDDRLSWQEQARLMDLLERALKRGVDLRMLRDGSPSYQAHVLEHGRLIWEKQPGELTQYGREVLPVLQAARRHSGEEWPRALSRLASR